MDLDDINVNLDWDPCYLAGIFDVDFNDMSELWASETFIPDCHILLAMENFESKNMKGVSFGDSSLDDNFLRDVVEKIEEK